VWFGVASAFSAMVWSLVQEAPAAAPAPADAAEEEEEKPAPKPKVSNFLGNGIAQGALCRLEVGRSSARRHFSTSSCADVANPHLRRTHPSSNSL